MSGLKNGGWWLMGGGLGGMVPPQKGASPTNEYTRVCPCGRVCVRWRWCWGNNKP